MAFRTKLDFSSNRQVKQHEKTITALSGGTSFGLPYDAMTSGPDLNTSAITQTFVSITGYTSTFSGNNTTTNYNWFDNRMVLGESVLSAITNTTSATTQITGGVYTAATNTTVDGNLVNLTYTGVSYNVRPLLVIDLGGGNYSGTVRTYKLDILSASTLDFTGRTIWNDVSGITRTERLIITDNPTIGYVWTCIDSEGMGEWQYNGTGSTSTIWTAGTGANSAVLGGSNGIASGSTSVSEGYGTIAGGTSSHAGGNQTTINGDYGFAHSAFATIDVDSDYSAILGGENHLIKKSTHSSIIGGYQNYITGNTGNNYNMILGGTGHTLTKTESSIILGGVLNTIDTAKYSIIVGGSGNTVTKNTDNLTQPTYSGIFAGKDNTIIPRIGYGGVGMSGSYCAIVGGESNTISGHSHSFIGGGFNNLIECDAAYNAIVAGQNNINHAFNGVIIGGQDNTLGFSTSCPSQAENSIILGGKFNKIALTSNNTFNTAIIGGDNNLINNTVNNISNTVILGGSYITANTSNTVYVPNMIINTGGTTSRLGINTSTPEYVIDAKGNNARLILADTYTGADLPFKGFALSANSANGPQIAAATNSYLGGFGLSLGMGVLGDNITSTSQTELLGTSGDTFISSSQKTNNLNIINRSGGSGANHIRMYAGVNSVSAASVPDFQIQGTGTTRGYIGIKTNNPEYLLDIIGSTTSRVFYDTTSSTGQFAISATTGLPRFGVATNSGVVNQNGGLSMGMRGWDDPTYDTYGKPGDSHIYSSKQANGLAIISSDGTGTEDYIECYVGGDANSGALAIHMHGTGSTKGYVGFNTNLPTQQIDVNGNGRFRSIGSSASSGALHYTADGTLTINTSDERLKTNITTLNGALNKVNQLRGVTYNWKENPSGDTRIGFIAQEVNSVVPELTFTNPNSPDKYMGVHYDNVTALLVEAVKELSSGIITTNNTYLETQTILAEDNNIDLNYSGTPESAIGGGIRVLHALGVDSSAELITDSEGNFITNNDFKPNSLTIPFYKPNSSEDINGNIGNITRDDEYLYIKCQDGWRRSSLERF